MGYARSSRPVGRATAGPVLFWLAVWLSAGPPPGAQPVLEPVKSSSSAQPVLEPVTSSPPVSTDQPDPAAARLLRCWLIGSIPPPLTVAPGREAAGLAGWRAYIIANEAGANAARERTLRNLYRRVDSPFLRAMILRNIAEDPSAQSRQAMFIRHYGFYYKRQLNKYR